jgi:hypothetical protein
MTSRTRPDRGAGRRANIGVGKVRMLSDDDRETLRELERRLAAEDTAFVQRFEAGAPGRRRTPPDASGLLQIGGTLVLALLMLLAGSMAGALAFAIVASLIGLAWRYAGEHDGGRSASPHRSG